jgi:hypothetical protein
MIQQQTNSKDDVSVHKVWFLAALTLKNGAYNHLLPPTIARDSHIPANGDGYTSLASFIPLLPI